jgi:serine/threonine-protein kinase
MILQRINSSFYPKNLGFEVIDGNRFCILEEYIESVSLTQQLAEYSEPNKAFSLLLDLIYGLSVIWEMHIVHRDIKPDNILITGNGKPKIIDLGIARLLDEESLTVSSAIRGPATPVYAAPEQLQNRKESIDCRTDQFNLGIILAQLLMSGKHPFDPTVVNSGLNIEENIISGNWCKEWFAGNYSPSVNGILVKLLGQEPYLRFRSPQLLIEKIQQIIKEGKYGN